MSARGRRELWVSSFLLLLIVAGLIDQWPGRGFWYDETVNAYFAQRSWSDLWDWCARIDNQMPLDFALRKLWGSAAGTGEFALRESSFFLAVLSAAGVMALARRLGGIWAGWLAALAFALSQSFLYAAFEVRPYALALALFAWSSVILWELWERYATASRPLGRRYSLLLAAYLLLALALLYTHYTAFLALAAHGAYLGWQTLAYRSRRRVAILISIGIGLAVGYLPWVLALAGRDARAGTAYADRISPRAALDTYAEFYAYGQQIAPAGAPPVAAGIAALVIVSALVWCGVNRPPRREFWFALAVAAVPLIGLLTMVYAVQAKLSGRHGWPIWIGAALLVGMGLAALRRLRGLRWPVWGAALALIWLPARADSQPIYNSYLREAFAYVNGHAAPGDVLILRDGTLFTAAGYYDARLPWIGLPPDKLTDVNRFLFVDEALDGLETLVDQNHARRVWVVAWQGHIMDPQNLAEGLLEAIGDPQPLPGAFGFGDVSVSLYALRDPPRALRERIDSLQPVAQTPPDGPIYLGGYIVSESPLPHGGSVQIHTWWQRGQTVMPGMRVSARLTTPDGAFYAQLDQPPVAASFGQEHWPPGSPILSRFTLWVPPEMPSGPAEVRIVLYDADGTFEPITVVVDRFDIRD